LVTKLKVGDESFAKDVLSTFIFNESIWSMYLDSDKTLFNYFKDLKLETTQFQLNSTRIDSIFIKNLEKRSILNNLNQIKFTFNQLLFKNNSKNDAKTLFTSVDYSNQHLLKCDWFYNPIRSHLMKLERLNKISNLVTIELDNDELMRIVMDLSNCLKFVYLIQVYFSDVIDSTVELTVQYQRLLYIFLFDSTIFLDSQIEMFLYLIFLRFVNKRDILKLNFNQKIEGILSFYDFYQALLVQYDATSFGNYVFSLYLILPLQQSLPVRYRQLFWSDYHHLFKYIKFNQDHNLIIPMDNFIKPNEKSLYMIRIYSQMLLNGDDYEVVSQSNFAYTVAIAHLNAFIFEHTSQVDNKIEFEFKHLLITKFNAIKNEVNIQVFFMNFLFYYFLIFFSLVVYIEIET
jgi:hypothetical protein